LSAICCGAMGVYFMLVFIFVLIIPDIYKIADSLATELKLNTAGALIISWYFISWYLTFG